METVGYFCGVPICVSKMAYKVEKIPRRKHKQRWRQTIAYHQRIQKKWDKRYGTVEKRTPCMYVMDLGVVLGGVNHGKAIVTHPDLWAKVKNDPRLLNGI